MSTYTRKYATLLAGGTCIYLPHLKAASDDQVLGADWTPVATDIKLIIDGAAAVTITNVPVAIAAGNGAVWKYTLTAAEMTGKTIQVNVSDSAAKVLKDDGFTIETFGDPSAMYAADLTAAALTALAILTTQMTETYSNLGVAPTVAQAFFEERSVLQASTLNASGTVLTAYKLDGITPWGTFAVTLDANGKPSSLRRLT